jgi:hypothetical protein
MKIGPISVGLAVLALLSVSLYAQAGSPGTVDGPFRFAGEAQIDGAFEHVTSGDNVYAPSVDWKASMPEGFQGTRSASYPWATATYGKSELWMGTISLGWCVWAFQNLGFPFQLTTYESRFTGCSLQSVLSTPSEIYIYDLEAGTRELIHEGSLTRGGKEYAATQQRHDEMAFLSVMGLRAAGTFGDLLFFAGHHLHSNSEGWLRIYVFNAKKREFLGVRELRGDTTRRFKTITDENGNEGFYTIIGAETGMLQNGKGPTVMLRWVGTEQEPFKGGNYLQTGDGEPAGWDVVSSEGLDGRYGMIGDFQQFTHIDGTERLIMSSAAHPLLYDPDTGERKPGLHESVMLLSEPVPAGGWTRGNPMDFEVVFDMARYDPDRRGRWGAKWGTTNVHGGYIYFGTYHQGNNAGYLHFKKANNALFEELTSSTDRHAEFAVNQWRASSIFRMKLEDLEAIRAGTKDPELLYGYTRFRVANEAGEWTDQKNGMGVEPLFGEAGLGHPGNIYSWTSLSKGDQLFWGFFDSFSGTHDLLFEADSSWFLLYPGLALPVPFSEHFRDTSLTRALYDWAKSEMSRKGLGEDFVPGGDLVVFEGDGAARILTKTGFGNPCANGIRNAEVLNDRIFFATSTWCNLSERAGMEIYEYIPELDKLGRIDE